MAPADKLIKEMTAGELREEILSLPKTYLVGVIKEVLINEIPKMPFFINAEKHYQDHSFINAVRRVWGVVWKAGAGLISILGLKHYLIK